MIIGTNSYLLLKLLNMHFYQLKKDIFNAEYAFLSMKEGVFYTTNVTDLCTVCLIWLILVNIFVQTCFQSIILHLNYGKLF